MLKEIKSTIQNSGIDISGVINKAKPSIEKTKKQMKEAFDPDDISGMTIKGIPTIKGASKELKNYKRNMQDVNLEAEQLSKNVSNVGYKKYDTKSIQEFVNNYSGQMQKANESSDKANETQNRLKKSLSDIKRKMEQIKEPMNKLTGDFNKLPNVVQKLSNSIKKVGTGIKNKLKHLSRFALALFSLRGIYSVLSNSANSWLSSQNNLAKQLSSNIEYMKYAMRKRIGSNN